MTGSSIAGVITAVGTFLTALTVFITAMVTLRRTRQLQGDVKQVHKIVNQQRTDLLRYQHALVLALTDAGIHVPRDQSQEPPAEISTKTQ